MQDIKGIQPPVGIILVCIPCFGGSGEITFFESNPLVNHD